MKETDQPTQGIATHVAPHGILPSSLKIATINGMKNAFVSTGTGERSVWSLLHSKGSANAMCVSTAIILTTLLIQGVPLANAKTLAKTKSVFSTAPLAYLKYIQVCLDTIHAHISNDVIFPRLVLDLGKGKKKLKHTPWKPSARPNAAHENDIVSPKTKETLDEDVRQHARDHGLDDPAVVQEALNEAAHVSPDFGVGEYSPASAVAKLTGHTFYQSDSDEELNALANSRDYGAEEIKVVSPPPPPPPPPRVPTRARRRRPDTPWSSPPMPRRRARRGATPPLLQGVRHLNFQVAVLTRYFDATLKQVGLVCDEDGHETVASSESDPDETESEEGQ